MMDHSVFGNVTSTYNTVSVEIAIYVIKLQNPFRTVANLQSVDSLFVKGGSVALPDEGSCS
jgi:hypothetical protein